MGQRRNGVGHGSPEGPNTVGHTSEWTLWVVAASCAVHPIDEYLSGWQPWALDTLGINIPSGTFHSLLSFEPGSVFFEAKSGPYRPLSPEEKAAWAPAEADPGAAAYLEHSLRNAGYTLECGDSPWVIDRGSPELLAA